MPAHMVAIPKRPISPYRVETRKAMNSYKKWQPWEDEAIVETVMLDRDISKKLGRSMEAIVARRARLHKHKGSGSTHA